MQTVTLNTPTANCGSCRAHIQEIMEDVKGVTQAELDVRSRQTTVEFDPDVIDHGRISQLITEAGYPVED